MHSLRECLLRALRTRALLTLLHLPGWTVWSFKNRGSAHEVPYSRCSRYGASVGRFGLRQKDLTFPRATDYLVVHFRS